MKYFEFCNYFFPRHLIVVVNVVVAVVVVVAKWAVETTFFNV